jgi:hypothetical protein
LTKSQIPSLKDSFKDNAGWGSETESNQASDGDSDFIAFIQLLQEDLVQEYTTGTLHYRIIHFYLLYFTKMLFLIGSIRRGYSS